jgi:UDP-N-acetylglucosamine 1-carboxyvinyltransferase
MSSFRIKGGVRLKGEIHPQGAKNEALQVLCAPLLTSKPVTIHNIPDIIDVNKLIELLGDLGCQVEKLGKGSYRFTASDINTEYLNLPRLILIPNI